MMDDGIARNKFIVILGHVENKCTEYVKYKKEWSHIIDVLVDDTVNIFFAF